jgi:hypothetical protein
MTTPNREQHQNDATTTLNGSITNSDSPITVTDGSVFPSSGNFRVMIDSEILICTARSTNSLTVSRGQDGTSAASHSSGATISMIYTAQGLSQLFQDDNAMTGYSSLTPQQGLWADDGSTILTSSDFTWQNQGGATISDVDGTVFMTAPTDSGRNVRIQERSAPSTPYTYIVGMQYLCPGQDGDAKPGFGCGFRESSSGKLMLLTILSESFFGPYISICVQRYSNTSTLFTTLNGPTPLLLMNDVAWMKMENDGTNLKWYVSTDGASWLLFFSESKTAYFSGNPDKVLWHAGNYLNSGSPAATMQARLIHWSKGE